MRRVKFCLSIVFCIFVVSSCTKSTEPGTNTTIIDSSYLIQHSVFEKSGQPFVGGWTFHAAEEGDTALFTNPGRYFITDVPSGGGMYSFRLHTSDFLNQYNQLTQSFTDLKSGIYSLSVWLKYKYVLDPTTFPPSWIGIIKSNGGAPVITKMNAVDSSTWQQQTILDTLTLLPTDTVTVVLSGGAKNGGPNAHGNPLSVDDVSFRRLP